MEEKDIAERLKETLESLTERLVELLDDGGVPKDLTSDIQRQLLLVHANNDTSASLTEQLQSAIDILSEATKVVEKSWAYCYCYPSLAVSNLSIILDELQTVLCESASLASKPLQRKIFVACRNAMLGACVDEFDTHKQWCKEALQRHELCDELEYDLEEL